MKAFKLFTFVFILSIGFLVTFAQENQKPPLDHSVYESWKDLHNNHISHDGNWLSYEINPQVGDGMLYLYDVKSDKLESFARGYDAEFSPESDYLVFKIKPQHAVTREAKMQKKKKNEMPKDSMGVWLMDKHSLIKFEKVKSFKLPEKEGSVFAFQHEKIYPLEKESERKKDMSETEKKAEKALAQKLKEDIKKIKNAKGTNLVVFNPVSGVKNVFEDVTEYVVAAGGNGLSFITQTKDSLVYSKVLFLESGKTSFIEILSQEGQAQNLTISEHGRQLAFLFSSDTSKIKIYDLYHWGEKMDGAMEVVNSASDGMNKDWCVSENGRLYFSENGEKLFFGTVAIPVKEPEDTLLDEEKYKVDVWTWNDPLLQTMQKLQANREKKRTYLAVYYSKNQKMVQLASTKIPEIQIFQKGNGIYAMGRSSLPYRKLVSWDQNRYTDYYLVDLHTGKAGLVVEKLSSRASVSPKGKYLYWFDNRDNIWYAQLIKTGRKIQLTSNLKVAFYDETDDRPSYPRAYGAAAWVGDDDYFLVYDAFDLWKLDPTEKKEPVNLTNAYGRENNIRLRYIQLDKETEFIKSNEEILLSGFHVKTKQSGFYSKSVKTNGDPSKIFMDDYRFYPPVKAKSANLLMWRKGSFEVFPDLWISELDFSKARKISTANPQQSDYNWGTVELVEWMSFDRRELQGLLYKPENFDPSKKYPMLVYFYERESDGLHSHWFPKPKRSKINRTFEVSNDYLVFAPDIVYTDGYPGESAYNAVVSGTMNLINRFSFIDKDRIGLNGQSWGGYQIAYLVTKTNLFKCAYSGAPVSNMTSAYGGIRWGSGASRMMQYEGGQSRIGGTLWEKPFQYIENSPIFFVPKINTPLLIMHNDTDGAVPWYQGIEFFVALRRLNKPAWMLVYNGEEHNLTKWPNKVDLAIRQLQFYDHFLKDKPAPVWMVNGIPAIDKGKYDAYDLVEEEMNKD